MSKTGQNEIKSILTASAWAFIIVLSKVLADLELFSLFSLVTPMRNGCILIAFLANKLEK